MTLGAVWRPALLAIGLVAAGLALRLLPGEGLQSWAAAQGPVAFVAVAAAACAVGVPRQVVAFAGGYAYGLWAGSGLALAGEALGCVADFLWARAVGRDWARARMRGRFGARLARLDGFLAAQPFTATLTLRLLPVGNNLAFTLLAGVSGVAAGPFLAASVLGYLPQTIIFALLGGGVRVDRAMQLGVAALLFVASALLAALMLRRRQIAALAAAAGGHPATSA
ncbi:MAG: VTT domain-containing protein [Acidisphaera sp.]|nr:VTT domain-containing protein [Acidisphaera sp.]